MTAVPVSVPLMVTSVSTLRVTLPASVAVTVTCSAPPLSRILDGAVDRLITFDTSSLSSSVTVAAFTVAMSELSVVPPKMMVSAGSSIMSSLGTMVTSTVPDCSSSSMVMVGAAGVNV